MAQNGLQHRLLLSKSSLSPPDETCAKAKMSTKNVKEQKLMELKSLDCILYLVCAEFPHGYSSVKTSHSLQHHHSDSVCTPAGVCMCSFICLFMASVRKLEVQVECRSYILWCYEQTNMQYTHAHTDIHTPIITQLQPPYSNFAYALHLHSWLFVVVVLFDICLV